MADGGPEISEATKVYVDLFKHWDSGYWTAVHVLLASQTLFFAAAGAAFKVQSGFPPFAGTVFAVGGLLIARTWAVVLARKRTYVQGAEDLLRQSLPDLYAGTGTWEERGRGKDDWAGTIRKHWEANEGSEVYRVGGSSAEAVQVCLPAILGTVWYLFIVFMWAGWLFETIGHGPSQLGP